MFKKILAVSVILTGVFAVSYAVFASTGSNFVKVDSCEQVGKDIRISRGGKSYVLTSTCRDAGHGFRDYKMTCVSRKEYKVEWTENCKPLPPPPPKDTVSPSLDLVSDKKSYYDGDTVYLTATANDNVKVKKIEIYGETGNLLRTCDYVGVCKTNTIIKFSAPNNINWGITGYSARAYDEAGNSTFKRIDVEVNRYPIYNLSVNGFSSTYDDNGVIWVKIGADAYADRGVSSVEIYLSGDSVKYRQSLVKKCNFNGGDRNVSCSLSFPRSIYSAGYYWVKVIDRDGRTKDSDLIRYSY